MFFFLPIGFDKVFERLPWVNVGLIAICTLVFLATIFFPGVWFVLLMLFPGWAEFGLDIVDQEGILFELPEKIGWAYRPWTLVTYAFLHLEFLHLFGNMLFLFCFGSALNSELGQLRYLGFFLAGCIVSGLGHVLLSDAPVIGASGGVCAVTGMVAALYPRNDVRIGWLVWIFYFVRVGVFECPALVVVGAWFAFDLYGQFVGGDSSPVAYGAHLAGSLLGFGLGILMLKLGWVESDGHDLLSAYFDAELPRVKKGKRPSDRRKRAQVVAEPEPVLLRTMPDDPIPLDGEEGNAASKPEAANRPPAAARSATRALNDFFRETVRVEDIDEDQRVKLKRWYRQATSEEGDVGLTPKVLIGMARLFASEKVVAASLSAYREAIKARKRPTSLALEAARFAVISNKPKATRGFLRLVDRGNLDPHQEKMLAAIESRLEHSGSR
ncbi:Rhomboid family protein [Planctomycetes bacterium Pan216]|uniref:Rhomboid family protein n=1 Tax=Kolteria novifilia TaxID=2527975 RepID=A0A518B1R3_9BACT|nr:Rhomboid family protein [Planctomycetes bacterium Pan216]